MLQKVLSLSGAKAVSLQQLDAGHAVLPDDEHRIKLHVKPDERQLKLFSTRAGLE